MKRNVAIYARVSTEHEAQLSALDNQIQYYDDILKKHPDWNLYKRYIDEGITGTSIKKRKNFMKMLEDAKNGYFDLIITREVSRFARNTVDTLQETRNLKRIGVEVYFTEDNIWTFNDEDGELKLTLMATLAQNESKKTSIRVKAGQMISFKNGVFYGTGNILGYDRIGKDMIVNPEQAKVVRLIYKRFLEGKGAQAIKFELESHGYLTGMGRKLWHPATILGILKNSFYCGIITYRKEYVADFLEQKKKINKGEIEKIVVEGRHEPIISKEDWNEVQEILKSKRRKNSEKKRSIGLYPPTSLWSKKLICQCGYHFNRKIYHTYADGKTYCYQCYNQKEHGSYSARLKKGLDVSTACDIGIVQEWKLNIIVNEVFSLLWNDKKRIIKIINSLIDESINSLEIDNEMLERIDELNKRKVKLNEQLERLLDAFLSGYLDKESYASKQIELKEKIQKINDDLLALNEKKGVDIQTIEFKINAIKKEITKSLNLTVNDITEELIDSLIKSIKVTKDKFIVDFNFCNEIYNENSEDTESTNKTFLSTLVINREKIKSYLEKTNRYLYPKKLDNLIVDIYI